MYVVRHGCAGDKARWPGDDLDRPLDAAGQAQALALSDVLSTAAIERILTSPAQRCHATVGPLGHRLDLPGEPVDDVLPGGDLHG